MQKQTTFEAEEAGITSQASSFAHASLKSAAGPTNKSHGLANGNFAQFKRRAKNLRESKDSQGN